MKKQVDLPGLKESEVAFVDVTITPMAKVLWQNSWRDLLDSKPYEPLTDAERDKLRQLYEDCK